ncbi:MAG: alpha/beta fold hydrolase [Maricaulaceae bacterium]
MTLTDHLEWIDLPGDPAPDGLESHRITGADDVSLRVVYAPAKGEAKGSVVIAPGRTEFVEKYAETMRELQARGFACVCVDHRGQGLSDRLLDNPLKGHVTRFEAYAEDFETVYTAFDDRLPGPRILLAHSMGGAIGLAVLLRGAVRFDGVLFSAPMWGLGGLNGAIARVIAEPVAGVAADFFAPGADRQAIEFDFDANPVTQDESRFDRAAARVKAERALAVAGPTWGWLAQAVETIKHFEDVQTVNALKSLETPITVLSAEKERLVNKASHERIAGLLPQSRRTTIPEARHELLQEVDAVRAQVFDEFDALVERVGGATAKAA